MNEKSKKFEVLPHTADLHIRAYGKTLSILFVNMLHGMFQSLGPQISSDTTSRRPIEVRASDRELLLVDFLSEALYLSDVHREAYLDMVIEEINTNYVKGVLIGSPIKAFDVGEIKAVTHHELKIEEMRDGGWVAEVLFDL